MENDGKMRIGLRIITQSVTRAVHNIGPVTTVDLQDVEGKQNCNKKDILEWKSTWDGWG